MLPIEIIAHINDYMRNSDLKILNKKIYQYINYEEMNDKWHQKYLNKMKELDLSNYVLCNDENFAYNWKQEFVRVSEYGYLKDLASIYEPYKDKNSNGLLHQLGFKGPYGSISSYLAQINNELRVSVHIVDIDIPKEFFKIVPLCYELVIHRDKKSNIHIPEQLMYLKELQYYKCFDSNLETFPKFLNHMKKLESVEIGGEIIYKSNDVKIAPSKIKYIPTNLIGNKCIINIDKYYIMYNKIYKKRKKNRGIEIDKVVHNFSEKKIIKISEFDDFYKRKKRQEYESWKYPLLIGFFTGVVISLNYLRKHD